MPRLLRRHREMRRDERRRAVLVFERDVGRVPRRRPNAGSPADRRRADPARSARPAPRAPPAAARVSIEPNAGMRMRRPHHHRISLARKVEIVAVAAPAGQQPKILPPPHRLPDPGIGRARPHQSLSRSRLLHHPAACANARSPSIWSIRMTYGQNDGQRAGRIAAADFKANCLRLMDEVARERRPIMITKRGKPVAKLVPVEERNRSTYSATWRGRPRFVATSSVRSTTSNGPAMPKTSEPRPLLFDTHVWIWLMLATPNWRSGAGRRSTAPPPRASSGSRQYRFGKLRCWARAAGSLWAVRWLSG